MHSIEPPRAIGSFRDAVGLAMEIADEYAFANAVAVLDGGGRCRWLALAGGIGGTADSLVAWLAASPDGGLVARSVAPTDCGTFDQGAAAALLVVSVGPCDPSVIREADLERYRRATGTAAAAGLRLIDWIETDGDAVRSYAYLVDPAGAWPDDPPVNRGDDSRPDVVRRPGSAARSNRPENPK